MAAYCASTDLVLGDIPLPTYLNVDQKIQDAADEIDSRIGYRYQTPVDLTNVELVRPARLFLKRANAHLASGRILLAVASPEENRNLHAYGYNLVKDVLAALDMIAAGETELTGAPLAPGAAEDPVTVPLISNLDAESNVEAFYDRIAYPFLGAADAERYPYPDRQTSL